MRANIAFLKQRSLSKSYVNRYKMRKKEYYTKIYNSGNLSQRRIFNFRR